mgnify:CR=1 FL=1
MTYLALRFDIDADAAEVWADALINSGALSVDIADACAALAPDLLRMDEAEHAQSKHRLGATHGMPANHAAAAGGPRPRARR